MQKRIILHGHLSEKHPEVISVEAETIAEALHALTQYPELAHPPGEPWPIYIEGVETPEDLYAVTPLSDIHIYPQMGGAGGKGGVFQVVLGITMIALAVVNPGFLAALNIGRGALFLSGAMLVTGGVLQMLAPSPELSSDNRSSKIGAGAGNTTRIGTTIPLAYGTQMLHGHFLSYNVDAVDMAEHDEDELDGKLRQAVMKDLPRQSREVGVYPLIDAINTDIKTQGVYAEVDKSDVPFAIVNPVFTSATTGPSNVPTSSWIV